MCPGSTNSMHGKSSLQLLGFLPRSSLGEGPVVTVIKCGPSVEGWGRGAVDHMGFVAERRADGVRGCPSARGTPGGDSLKCEGCGTSGRGRDRQRRCPVVRGYVGAAGEAGGLSETSFPLSM